MKTNSLIATIVKGCAMAVALSAYAMSASAAPVPYANTGVENTIEYSFTALADGDIVAYFAGKGDATYHNWLGILINGVDASATGLGNQSSSYGDSINFGHANAGDTITFAIYTGELNQVWYSSKADNTDGSNHIYSSTFAGDQVLPAGIYVAFEDLFANGSDFNYTDEQFVVTNVGYGRPTTPEVPVPAAAWLFGSGLAGLAGVARRRAQV